MLIDWKSQVVSGTDDVPGLLESVLDLARCEKCGGSSILVEGQPHEQQHAPQ